VRILHGSTGYEPRFVDVVFAKCVKRKERKISLEDQEIASSILVSIVNAKNNFRVCCNSRTLHNVAFHKELAVLIARFINKILQLRSSCPITGECWRINNRLGAMKMRAHFAWFNTVHRPIEEISFF